MPTCSPLLTADQIEADGLDTADTDAIIAAARTVLIRLAGGRHVGECTHVIRPYRSPVCVPPSAAALTAERLDAIPLGPTVASITEVKIDGVVIDAANYGIGRIGGLKHLIRKDADSWPTSQDWKLASTETNTFEVTLVTGEPPDKLTVNAAVEVANELAKNLLDEADCAFGPGVTRATHQGVSVNYELAADQTSEAGRFPAVAHFVAAYNPYGRPPGELYTPDVAGWTMAEWA